MNLKKRILAYLSGFHFRKVDLEELSRVLEASYEAVYKACEELVNQGILEKEKRKGKNYYYLTNKVRTPPLTKFFKNAQASLEYMLLTAITLLLSLIAFALFIKTLF